MKRRKLKEAELLAWINHYRQALKYIRHVEAPFTQAWRICQRTLQNPPKELISHNPKSTQLELFP